MAWRRHHLPSLLIAFCILISTTQSVAVVDNSTNDSANLTIEHNGITYHVFVDEVMWREAYSLCKEKHSVLAKIPDQATQDIITTNLNNNKLLKKGSFWIDANDEIEEGVWVDSAFNELTYTAWAPDEPNNGGHSRHTENCAHLWWEHAFKWNDNWCDSHIYFICQTGMASECYTTEDGHDYLGSVSTTETGLECQYWSEQTPHAHKSHKPYPSLKGHNYCRNPDGSGDKPWCYTTDPDTRWEYCSVGYSQLVCDEDDIECFERNDGRDYRGHINATETSKICQSWNVQTPHRHHFRGDDYLGEHNYCRNPNYSSRPWCYTTDPDILWQYCDVCGDDQTYTVKNIALNKRASQSSLFSAMGHASNAVDGFVSSFWGDESCSHTNIEQDPWWKVDLENAYFVTDVVITNRRDCCSERLEGAVVRVGMSSDIGSNNPCRDAVSPHTAKDLATISFECASDTYGRYVSVQLEGKNQYLSLCEVEVHGKRAILWRQDQRCGYEYPTISNINGQCNPADGFRCCSEFGWCGSSEDYCDCFHCIDYREVYGKDDSEEEVEEETGEPWREDLQCGPGFTAPNGVSPAECDPHGIYPCCSTARWCGISDDHCKCDECIDYREVYKVTESPVDACSEPKRITIPDDGELIVTSPAYPNFYPSYANCRWFITANSNFDVEITVNEVDLETCCANVYIGTGDTLRLHELITITNTMTTSMVAESNKVWIQFVSSASQVQRGEGFSITLKTKSRGNAWREDLQCGPEFTAPNGVSPAECDPHGIYPCCSTANWCGISNDHCKCVECIDYRKVYGVTESPVDACSRPKRITIPDDGEVTVTSPAYPNFYPSYANCRWFITADSELDIEVTVNKVDLETCCANVYIGTGDTLRRNELFTITNTMTTSMVAESNKVWIRFVSSASQVQRGEGFSITLKPKSKGNAWREDVQCGPGFTAPNGVSPAECDPHGIYPCCSTANWCGISDDHCKCYGCIDYREFYGVTESPVDACSEPKRITIPDDGEVTVTSPTYPNMYPSYANCRWFIAANPDLDIEVTVNEVDLETCCANVYIGTGDTLRQNELFTITNTMTTSTVAESNKVWIQFVSSASQVQRGEGFSITLKPKSRASSCVSRWSEISGPGDDVQVEIECEEGEVMTSCNSVTDGSESHGTRDGERIIQVTSKPTCVAQNGEGGLGVYAVARCCKWSGLQCLYTESLWKSGSEEDDVAEAMCDTSVNDLPASTLGCMAYSYGQSLDGARPWTESDEFLTNAQMDFVKNGCVAQNGIYGNGVWSEASCCSAPGLQCQHIYSDRSDGTSGAVAHVQCEEGWVMTGCSVFTYWGITDGAYVTGDGICKAINGGKARMGNNTRGVWAVAVCCKSSDQ